MVDVKGNMKYGWDEKEMKELIPLEKWPCLTAEDNKTKIDFSKGYTLDVRNMDFMDPDVLRDIGRNLRLDVSDLKTLKNNITELNKDFKSFTQKRKIKRDAALPLEPKNVILIFTSLVESCVFLIQEGRIIYSEERNNKGNLSARSYYNNEMIYYFELWYYDGILQRKAHFDDKELLIGPFYEYDAPNNPTPYIKYSLNGEMISKEEWQDYVLRSRVGLRESGVLINDISTIIDSYTNF